MHEKAQAERGTAPVSLLGSHFRKTNFCSIHFQFFVEKIEGTKAIKHNNSIGRPPLKTLGKFDPPLSKGVPPPLYCEQFFLVDSNVFGNDKCQANGFANRQICLFNPFWRGHCLCKWWGGGLWNAYQAHFIGCTTSADFISSVPSPKSRVSRAMSAK